MMARSVNKVLWDQWRERVKRQRGSGLSIAEFCRRENIASHKFHVWKRKLRQAMPGRRTAGTIAPAQRGPKQRSDIMPRRRHDRLPARSAMPLGAEGFLQLPLAARPAPWIELALADGTVIRLPQQNVAALVAVLRVLRGEGVGYAQAEHSDA
jgi:hypothetical protein